jgi:hypothetical protein
MHGETKLFDKIVAGLMVLSGLLTLTMIYAAVAPTNAAQSMFGEAPEGAMATIVLPNWGVLIGIMGGLLVYGAFHPPSRKLALATAGASKVAFIVLVLSQGQRYLSGLGAAIAVDAIMVAVFAVYLIFGRTSARS